MKTAAQARQLADWLVGTGIGLLELRTPDGVLRLGLDAASGRFVTLPAADADADADSRLPSPVTATAPSVGVFLAVHPLHVAPLVAVGERVAAGQPVGLMQVGCLLLPVAAPCDGAVTALPGPHGAAVGYGAPLVALNPT